MDSYVALNMLLVYIFKYNKMFTIPTNLVLIVYIKYLVIMNGKVYA